jgi:peptidyl-prolyl cis-trans isomerase B (cyclophilin B)
MNKEKIVSIILSLVLLVVIVLLVNKWYLNPSQEEDLIKADDISLIGDGTVGDDNNLEEDTMEETVAVLETNQGIIKLSLFSEDAPKTVNNFKTLIKDGFYDGLIFHRVIKDFMIQGGDPDGNGTGGPGYTFLDEFNSKKMVRGRLAMANSGPDTNGSQFFIVTIEEAPWLDGKHTVFGEVIEGMDIVDLIEGVTVGASDKPVEDQVISKAILE